MAVLAAGYWYFFMRGIVFSDDARFDGQLVDLAPAISGLLTEVRAAEGDKVTKGETLFVLDKSMLSAALAQAQYDKAVHGPRPEEVKVARAEMAKLAASLRLAAADLARSRSLYEKKNLPKSDLDQAQTKWETAKFAFEESFGQLRLLLEGTRPEDIAAAKANLELAQARLAGAVAATRRAKANLGYAEGKAPFDGMVVRRWLDPGAMATAAQPVLTVFDPRTLRVAANIDEKDLGHIAVGERVDISIDAYPGVHLTGRVKEILRATNSQFGLIPAEGSGGTFIKVSQRVPVRINLDHLPELLLGPGLSVEVRIHIAADNSAGKTAATHE